MHAESNQGTSINTSSSNNSTNNEQQQQRQLNDHHDVIDLVNSDNDNSPYHMDFETTQVYNASDNDDSGQDMDDFMALMMARRHARPFYDSDDDYDSDNEIFMQILRGGSTASLLDHAQAEMRLEKSDAPIPKLTNLGAQLPIDIMEKICQFVPGMWIARSIMPTCTTFYKFFDKNEKIWQQKFELEFTTMSSNNLDVPWMLNFWYFRPWSKSNISNFFTFQRCYQICYATNLTHRCGYCFRNNVEWYHAGSKLSWKICKKCEANKDVFLLKNEVKRRYCLKPSEFDKLLPVFGENFWLNSQADYVMYLREEVEAYIKQIFADPQQEVASRRKLFTTFDAQAMKQRLDKRALFYEKLAAKLKVDAPSVPEYRIPAILHRFKYEDSKISIEKFDKDEQVLQFVKHWEGQYSFYSKMSKVYDNIAGKLDPVKEDVRMDMLPVLSDPIFGSNFGRSSEQISKDNMHFMETCAKRVLREVEGKRYANAQINKLTNGKYTSMNTLFNMARQEIEAACSNLNPEREKMEPQLDAAIAKALELNAREELLSQHLAAFGMNYLFFSQPKEVTDYVKGKSDLTFHQVLLKAVREASNPYSSVSHVFYFVARSRPISDKKLIAQQLYLQLFGPEAVNNKKILEQVQVQIEEQNKQLEALQQQQQIQHNQEQKKIKDKGKGKQRASTSGSAASSSSASSSSTPSFSFGKRITAKPRKMKQAIYSTLERTNGTVLHYFYTQLFKKNAFAAGSQSSSCGSSKQVSKVDEMDE